MLGNNNSQRNCRFYVNASMQYVAILTVVEMAIFSWKTDMILIFAQNIDCGYSLELPQ